MPINQNDLNEVIQKLALDCTDAKKELLYNYIELLFRWHDKSNILSTRDKQYFIKRDLFDTLSMLRDLPEGRLLDIGTGAGIPGMLVSFFRPDSHITLLDRRDNAIRFLDHAKLKLGLNNGFELMDYVDAKPIPSSKKYDLEKYKLTTTLPTFILFKWKKKS